MKGFAPAYDDLPDFIYKITKEIWEDRGIHVLEHRYAPNIPVRAPAGLVVGNKAVIAATMATLAEFPDRKLLGEDVIWNYDEKYGYLSSHRLLSTATHLGNGVYGPATGKRLVYRIIADCAARENHIYDEWIVRDQGAVVRQLGINPKRFAADQIEREGGPENAKRVFTPDQDVDGGYGGGGNKNKYGERYAEILKRIFNNDFAAINEHYDRAVQLELPSGVRAHGRPAIDEFWLGLRSAFPNAGFKIEHQIGREDSMMSPRAALRWSLYGRHEGYGAFGDPTGADVYIMGISHAEFGPWGLRREHILIDETAVWKQILMKTG